LNQKAHQPRYNQPYLQKLLYKFYNPPINVV